MSSDTIERLSERSKQYLKYHRLGFGIFMILYISLMGIPVSFLSFFPISIPFFTLIGELQVNILTIMSLIICIPSWFSFKKFRKKRNLYSLSPEEWLVLDINEVNKNLNNYFQDKRDVYLMNAIKNMEKAVEKISDGWGIGRLKLVKNLVGEQINSFKRNIKQRLLPAIRAGNEEGLKSSLKILELISNFLLNPSVEQLDVINDGMLIFRTITVKKLSTLDKFKISPMQHLLPLSGCVIGGIFAFCFGLYFLDVSKETSYIAGFTFAGVLLTAYITYITRK